MKRLKDNEELLAQSMACTHLIQGCEDAASDLALVAGNACEPPAIRERAQDILADVLSSWQEALEALRPLDAPEAVPTTANSLDGWTSDQLFAEAVGRRAGDAPALRIMHATLLEARLSAHDRDSAHASAGR